MDSTTNTGTSDMQSIQQGSVTSKPKKNYLRRTQKILRKYWFVVIIVVFILGASLAWLMLSMQQASAWQKASDYFEHADYENAKKELSKVSIPSDKDKLRIYAQTMLATGELDMSLEAYSKLYEINSDASVKLIIANIYNQQKKYDEAIKIYKEIIATNESNVQAYVNLATVYRLQGDNEAAASLSEQAVEKNPNNITLLELRVSMLLENKNTDQYAKAVEALRVANPEDPLLTALKN